MRRRTFLKSSAIGFGSLAGIYGGMREAQAGGAVPGALAAAGAGIAEIADSRKLSWGTNSAVLKSPWTKSPSLEDLLADRDHTLIFSQFFRAGRDARLATPTQCHVAYNGDVLLVAFRCMESDMSFPYANLDPQLWSRANWDALNGLPSGATSSWPPFPDEVDILIQPDREMPVYYQFAATPQGKKFGCKRTLFPDVDASADEAALARDSMHVAQADAFEADIVRKSDEWLVLFQIPWQTLGGKPKSNFGLLPMRTRWRGGEFSSPVALDLNESMPIDLLIETHFSDTPRGPDAGNSLCQLPSGMLRWQTPAAPAYPDAETCRQIWQMQSSLATPTDTSTLAQRLFLAQRWMDLMMLEGFTPLRTGWALLPNDLSLAFVRQRVNAAFQKNDPKQACKIVDAYLHQFDEMSRWWHADGSPGNIASNAWVSITDASSLELQGRSLLMRCVAGEHKVDLRLALPASGGVRIYGKDQGYWRPHDVLPLDASQASGSCSIKTDNGTIIVRQRPFSIALHDSAENEVVRIEGKDLAFRFGPDGKVLATDFRTRLDSHEVIYGFGEQYDRFNRNGNVLTLWGTDDTIGNGKGLANATYKPLPIFHSSRPYMVFCNSSYRLRADIGKADPGQLRLTQHGPIFDYYFWTEAPAKALQSYTALTGRPPLPPKWAFEPWLGRGSGAWADGQLKDTLAWESGEVGEAVAEEERVIKRFAELDIPHSAIYAEGPSALSTDFNRFLAPRGIRTLGYFRPEIGPARQKLLMPDVKSEELPILHCGTEQQTNTLGYVDFTNPNAPELCRRALARGFELGLAGSMVDFGDWVPDNAVFHNGQRGSELHNFYAYDYQRTISELFRERRGDDFILYARAAAPGTQRWLGQFAGDHPSNFDGLEHVLTGALNLCACGYSTWGSDIGGYFGFPQPAVYMRWVQLGCFSPLMRPHGIAPREPWHYGEAAVSNYKFLAWTRENILSYIHNAAAIAHETGLPIMRSMPVAFPGEAPVAAVADQYMFGPALLVAPVVSEGVSRTVTFPSGLWTSLWDGKTIAGPANVRTAAPLDTIPVYLKSGAIMAVELNRRLQFGESMTAGRVHALVVTPPSGNEIAVFANAQGDTARVTAQANDDGMSWTLENLPETDYVLVYGTTAASTIMVDGEALPKLKSIEPGSGGWQADQARNRLIIRLPSGRVQQSNPGVKIELRVKPVARQK